MMISLGRYIVPPSRAEPASFRELAVCDNWDDEVAVLESWKHMKSAETEDCVRRRLLTKLLERPESDLVWILDKVLTVLPGLVNLLHQPRKHPDGELEEEMQPIISRSPSLQKEAGKSLSCPFTMTGVETLPVIQFAKSGYFAIEGEDHAEIDVIRLGDLSQVSRVRYRTINGTAVDGEQITAVSGTLIFQPGESVSEVLVPLLDPPNWSSICEFDVALETEGLEGATLTSDLSHATVTIMDNDTFPTDKHHDKIPYKLDEVSPFSLFFEYCKMQWKHMGVRRATMKTVLADAVHNVYYFVKALLQMYLIDFVLNPTRDESDLCWPPSRLANLIMAAAVIILPTFLLHFLDYYSPFGIGRISRTMLIKGVICRFLHYNTESRGAVLDGDLIMAAARDSVNLVQDGYKNVLTVVRQLGQLLAVCMIQFLAPMLFGHEIRWAGLVPLVIFPVFLFCFLSFRIRTTTMTLDEEHKRQDDIVDLITDSIENYRLIADYKCRSEVLSRCENRVNAYHNARRDSKHVMTNNVYFPQWIATCCVAFYTAVGGWYVLHGGLSMGVYLTNIRIFEQMGTNYKQIYMACLNIQSVFPSLLRVTLLLNLPTNLQSYMQITRSSHKLAHRLAKKFSKGDHHSEVMDMLPIRVGGFHFHYGEAKVQRKLRPRRSGSELLPSTCDSQRPSQTSLLEGDASMSNHSSLNFGGRLEFDQGSFVRLVGPHGEGKSTLLKVLSGVILPEPEEILSNGGVNFFVPPHLHVLHVASSPLFFKATLYWNLTIGVRKGTEDGRLSRVEKICRRLGLSEYIISLLSRDEAHSWKDRVSHAESTVLCVARALIANPDVICIERHWMGFDDEISSRILAMLREHVLYRGIDQDPQSLHLRRPRTCIMTCNSAHGHDEGLGDRTFHVDLKDGIKELVPAECPNVQYRDAWDVRV